MAEPISEPAAEPTWRAVEAVPVALLALIVTSFASALAAVAGAGDGAFLLAGFVFEASLAGFTILWVATRHPGSLPALRLSSTRTARDVAAGFWAGLATFAAAVLVVAPLIYFLIGLLSGGPIEPPQQEVLPANPSTMLVVLGGFVVILAAPFGEEVFFRGFLHSALRRRLGFPAAAAISSAVFAAFHVIPLLMPVMFAVGMALATVYERRASLLAAVAAHAAFNLVGYILIVLALR
ncbi:MAG: lysostaphin resistance A-like protein [Actinomycetota bacterium]